MENKKRLIFPDMLRIIAIFSVIVLHAVGELLGLIPEKSGSWTALVAIDSLFRFAAPVFIMISGMFMLSPEKDRGLKDLYFKKILRLVTAFIFWSAIYLVCHRIIGDNENLSSVKAMIKSFLEGEYHLWFIYTIIGLYIVTPIFRKIADSKKSMQFFLVLWAIFCLFKNLAALVPVFGELAANGMALFKISIAVEYSGYYVLGYYLNEYPLKKPSKKVVYVLAVLGTIAMCLLTIAYPSSNVAKYFDYLLPMTALQSAAVFILVKDIYTVRTPSPKVAKTIAVLSQISFGVYLSHLLVMKLVKYACITKLSLPMLAVFVILLVSTTVLSTTISYVLNKIPKANKYIV